MTHDELTALIEAIVAMRTSASDGQALNAVAIYPAWNGDAVSYSADDRVKYNGILYKCLQAHTSQPTWTPTDAPSLWAKVLNEGDTIPVWEQPDSTNAYMKGDKVYYPTANDDIYESLIDNNIWSPDAYPAGWQKVS